MNKFFISICSLPAILLSDTYYIDFTKFPKLCIDNHRPQEFREIGASGFNWAPELTPYFLFLKEKFNIEACIETGTSRGESTLAFSRIFNSVDSIELDATTFDNAKERFKGNKNITLHFGDSAKLIQPISELKKDKFVLYYLDAHWNDFWPLLDEIEGISKTHKNNCVIVIDDFKVPGRPEIYYDFYNNKECSHEYIKEKLQLVYDDYDVIYLIPNNIHSKAKFVAIPRGR